MIGTNYYWNKCFLVFPLDIRQVTRTDPNPDELYSIYGPFVDVREDSALILVPKILIDPEVRQGSLGSYLGLLFEDYGDGFLSLLDP